MTAPGAPLLHCLLGMPVPELTGADWAQILRQAGENGVSSLLYHRLRTSPSAPPVPPSALGQLRAAAVRSAAQSLQIGRDLAQVLQTLGRRGIPVIVLKGGHLGQVVYESFALRTMCDLDIMVKRDDTGRAAEILAELGYVPQYYGVEEVDYARHHHLRPMARPDGIRVEIHWNIARPDGPFQIDLDGLWERAQRASIVGVEALVLSPEDLILHLCLHSSFTHKFRIGLRMCWDIREVVRHYRDAIDWDLLVRRAQQWGIGKYVYLTLRLVHELLDADIPIPLLAALEPPGFSPDVLVWARTSIFLPGSDVSVTPSMARLWTARRLRAKFGVLLGILYPSRTALARNYQAPPNSVRIYLYYPLRWADILLRHGRHAWRLCRGDHHAHDELRATSERIALKDWLRQV